MFALGMAAYDLHCEKPAILETTCILLEPADPAKFRPRRFLIITVVKVVEAMTCSPEKMLSCGLGLRGPFVRCSRSALCPSQDLCYMCWCSYRWPDNSAVERRDHFPKL
jgi:hypothetical protein